MQWTSNGILPLVKWNAYLERLELAKPSLTTWYQPATFTIAFPCFPGENILHSV